MVFLCLKSSVFLHNQNLYIMIKNIHSIWAYIVLFALVIAVINAVAGLVRKKEFTHKDFRLGLITLITTHIQFLIGIFLYASSGRFNINGAVMKDSAARLLAIEHPTVMLIAIILITIGWSKHKKQVKSESKFKKFAIFYGIALVLILSRIPWSNWL